ncbi:serine/threonine protein kinase [Nannocystis sp. SCPEA4]|uniref:serine/threonine-protein kinase n=1 Tax=Nannocystis sp. SCPEA4 TaxID=2996787 RepID=UPI0022704594|nr:serine/threonine protein kinase [Nannocystis sp. SCPEA4]MCY1063023.1 protein kinase [Nannocystis sp. SCPEA4]
MVVSTPPRTAACRTCGESFRDDILLCPNDGVPLPLEGRLLDGKFRLDKRLGHGGMATVWQATNEFVQRPVAIKLMHASYAEDADLLARFRNEATAAGRIGSPHICDVLDFGRSTIGPYIVMELLSGCSLSDLIDAYQRLQPGLAVWILRQALAGLHAAHQAGIIHRDLKPENIYLCRAIRDQWLVKLMDFGISKFNDSIRTGAGTMMGSPNYMAPEQIHGAGAVDRRADVWSVGAILYEALAGQQAFARDTIADSLAAVRGYDPPPVHSLVPDVPPGLSEIVARCLRKQPDQRWPSAAALAEALLPFERPGRLLPTTPIGDAPQLTDTAPRTPAAPRALADAEPAPVPNARSTGGHPTVPNARSTGGHPTVPNARSTGGHPTVPNARSTGGHPAVPKASSSETSGTRLPPPRPGAAGPSGAHPVVARPGAPGAHAPRTLSGAHPPVAAAPSGAPPTVARPGPAGPHAPRTLSGAHSAVPKASAATSDAHATVPADGHQPALKAISGAHPPVLAPGSSGVHAAVPRAGAAPVPKTTSASPVSSAIPRTRAANHPAADPHPLLVFAILAAIGVTAAAIAWLAL